MTCDGVTPDEIGRRVGRSGKTVRAWLRRRWPELAPGQGGQWYLRHHQVQEALAHFGGAAARSPALERAVPRPPRETKQTPRRTGAESDEAYVIGIVGELLGEEPLMGHRFDWLRGDAGTTLPVDAYFPKSELVVEYRERQHLADRIDDFKLWDNKPTVSGMPRREQRARYDKLREREIPLHGIRLLIVNADDLAHDARGRLRRERDADRKRLQTMLTQVPNEG